MWGFLAKVNYYKNSSIYPVWRGANLEPLLWTITAPNMNKLNIFFSKISQQTDSGYAKTAQITHMWRISDKLILLYQI